MYFDKPNVGQNNVLSISEIRWCVRAGIAIDFTNDYIRDNNTKIELYNRFVEDYNSRCGKFQYYEGDLDKAIREVEPHKKQIESEMLKILMNQKD